MITKGTNKGKRERERGHQKKKCRKSVMKKKNTASPSPSFILRSSKTNAALLRRCTDDTHSGLQQNIQLRDRVAATFF